jgi:hypothetical protein
VIFFRVDGPRDAPVPVYWQNDLEPPSAKWPSIAAFVRTILDLIESGTWAVGSGGRWQIDRQSVPAECRAL